MLSFFVPGTSANGGTRIFPTAEEVESVLAAIAFGRRPSNYRLRLLYDELTSLPSAIETYEPRLYSNPTCPREVLP